MSAIPNNLWCLTIAVAYIYMNPPVIYAYTCDAAFQGSLYDFILIGVVVGTYIYRYAEGMRAIACPPFR